MPGNLGTRLVPAMENEWELPLSVGICLLARAFRGDKATLYFVIGLPGRGFDGVIFQKTIHLPGYPESGASLPDPVSSGPDLVCLGDPHLDG